MTGGLSAGWFIYRGGGEIVRRTASKKAGCLNASEGCAKPFVIS